MVHNINFDDMNGSRLFETTKFSSINFMNLYMKNVLSRNIPANFFDDYKKIFQLDNVVEAIVNYINVNNGSVVIGWYERGEIKDKEQVDASNMIIHPVSIYSYHQTITPAKFIRDNVFDFNSEN